jgi:hypothetical protein
VVDLKVKQITFRDTIRAFRYATEFIDEQGQDKLWDITINFDKDGNSTIYLYGLWEEEE